MVGEILNGNDKNAISAATPANIDVPCADSKQIYPGYPLLIAVMNGRPRVLEHLLKLGANKHVKTWKNESAISVCVNSCPAPVRSECLKILLHHGCDFRDTDANGFAPIHVASMHGDRESLEVLLKLGADVNASTKSDITPLHLAAKMGRVECIEILLKQGADAGRKDSAGDTPVDLAKKRKDPEAANLLEKTDGKP